jgi:hypothetical protein
LAYAGKLIGGTAITLVGLLATYFAIWEVWLRTAPTVSPPEVTSTFDVLPFTITNQSPFFQMYGVSLKCDTTSYGLVFPGSSKRHKIAFRVVTTTPFDILPEQSSKMECSIPFLWTNPNAQMTDGKVLDEISKVKLATMAVSAKYETNIFGWKIGRESAPTSFAWEATGAGQHYWAPYDPNSVPLDKYYGSAP